MKKVKVIIMVMMLGLGINSVKAQSDAYFSDWNDYRNGTEDPTAPLIPASHGLENNSQAPLGSGLLLLAGLGIAYGVRNSRKS